MKSCSERLPEKGVMVAPFAGAWIEIMRTKSTSSKILSLPSRERGLKFEECPENYARCESLPSRERGLKFFLVLLWMNMQKVAPFAGAWIEIERHSQVHELLPVAPFAGAWIEMVKEVVKI